MHRTLRACTAPALALTCAVCLGAAAPPAAPAAEKCTDQSPRRLDRIPHESKTSAVAPGPDDTLFYTAGATHGIVTLHRCGQHYHCQIENFQGCPGQVPTTDPPPVCPAHLPVPGPAWVEIHTVYAAEVSDAPCDPETLDCCKAGPFVVMAYQAQVLSSPVQGVVAPVPVLWGLPAAEWSGSNTGWDPPGACKPVHAWWSFIMGCNFAVTENQLKVFRHADAARRLQPEDRLSKDLVLVKKPEH